MTFGCLAMTLFSRSRYGPFDANVSCCVFFSCFSTYMINLAIRDDSNAIQQWIRCNCWPVTPYRLYDVIAGHENIYVNHSSQNRGRAVGEVPMCLSRQGTSTDMQQDLPEPFIRSFDPTKGQISNWPFEVKMHMFWCVFTRGVRWCQAFFSIFVISKVICTNVNFPKRQHCMFDMPWEGQNVT